MNDNLFDIVLPWVVKQPGYYYTFHLEDGVSLGGCYVRKFNLAEASNEKKCLAVEVNYISKREIETFVLD